MKPIVAAVDIGGTNTKIGLFDDQLILIANSVIETPRVSLLTPKMDVFPYLDRIANEIRRLVKETVNPGQLQGIGIGAPGKVNSKLGIVYNAANLGWDEVHLSAEMIRRLNVPVVIEHDVSAHAIGEAIAGAGVGYKDIICVTVGTGLAAGIIIDGNVVHGGDWSAGEIGHDVIDGAKLPCLCGKIGCLETVVSGPGIARSAEELVRSGNLSSLAYLKGKITASDVFHAADKGDKDAIGIFERTGTLLGRRLSTLVYTLDPEIIIIGGGVASAGDVLLSPIRSELWKQCPPQRSFLVVTLAVLGDKAGLIGAAHTILNSIEP